MDFIYISGVYTTNDMQDRQIVLIAVSLTVHFFFGLSFSTIVLGSSVRFGRLPFNFYTALPKNTIVMTGFT